MMIPSEKLFFKNLAVLSVLWGTTEYDHAFIFGVDSSLKPCTDSKQQIPATTSELVIG